MRCIANQAGMMRYGKYADSKIPSWVMGKSALQMVAVISGSVP